jgi:hypothetical protein
MILIEKATLSSNKTYLCPGDLVFLFRVSTWVPVFVLEFIRVFPQPLQTNFWNYHEITKIHIYLIFAPVNTGTVESSVKCNVEDICVSIW